MEEEVILQAVVLGQLLSRKEESSSVSFLLSSHYVCSRDVLRTQGIARELAYWVRGTF